MFQCIRLKGRIRIRIRIKAISWIRIRIDLQIKSQNARTISLFEHFFKVLSLYLEAKIQIRFRIKMKGRIWIRIKVTSRIRIRIRLHIKVMRIRNTGSYVLVPTLLFVFVPGVCISCSHLFAKFRENLVNIFRRVSMEVHSFWEILKGQ